MAHEQARWQRLFQNIPTIHYRHTEVTTCARYVRGEAVSYGSPLYNAARTELYLVPISGLLGT